MELVIITGLSGAGKSHAVQCMEDIGYYCIDNLPPELMHDFLALTAGKVGLEKIAFVMDVRGGTFFDSLEPSLADVRSICDDYKLIFLDASDSVLIKRYKETRRSHPLAANGDIGEGIALERAKLEHLKKEADYVIDTTDYKAAQLNAEIKRILKSEDKDSFNLTVMSFGYKHGMPEEADWVLDARFLPNPYYVPSLKKLTGKNKKVQQYVLNCSEAIQFAGRITGLVLDLISNYIKEGKYHLTIAIGCTGGQHRSVVMANEIARRLEENGRHAFVKHRDIQ